MPMAYAGVARHAALYREQGPTGGGDEELLDSVSRETCNMCIELLVWYIGGY